jgi:hypothetical protein
MNGKQIAKIIREAANGVSPSYHYDTIDSKIASAFRELADEFERHEEEAAS